MTTYLNALRTVAILCIAGKAVAISFAAAEQGELLSATMNSLLTNFLLLTLGYFSFEFGVRYFIWPNARQIYTVATFKKRKKAAVEKAVGVEPAKPTIPVSPLDTPKAQEVIAYTLGTFAGVLTNDELMLLDQNLKAFILGETELRPAVNRRIPRLLVHDVYHFGWNIVKRLPKKNAEMAVFLKSQFPWHLADNDLTTIAKKLSSEDGNYSIPKVEKRLPLPPFPLAKELGIC